MFCELGASGFRAHLTLVLSVVFGVLLVLNSLGCFFGLRWKRRRGQTGTVAAFIIYIVAVPFLRHDCWIPEKKKNSREIVLNRDVRVSAASHLLLSFPCPSFYLSSPSAHSLSPYLPTHSSIKPVTSYTSVISFAFMSFLRLSICLFLFVLQSFSPDLHLSPSAFSSSGFNIQ